MHAIILPNGWHYCAMLQAISPSHYCSRPSKQLRLTSLRSSQCKLDNTPRLYTECASGHIEQQNILMDDKTPIQSRLLRLGEQVAESQAVGQLHQRLPVLIAGPHSSILPTPHRLAISPNAVVQSPTRTGPTPPGTASGAPGSRRLFFCSSCAVEAWRKMSSRSAAGGSFPGECKRPVSPPPQTLTAPVSDSISPVSPVHASVLAFFVARKGGLSSGPAPRYFAGEPA